MKTFASDNKKLRFYDEKQNRSIFIKFNKKIRLMQEQEEIFCNITKRVQNSIDRAKKQREERKAKRLSR